MGKASDFRRLRRIAKESSYVDYRTTNENIDIQQIKSGRMVTNSQGQWVEEIVPKVVFNTKLVDGCARKIYKELKKEMKNGSPN